jgi:hypothetical protein
MARRSRSRYHEALIDPDAKEFITGARDKFKQAESAETQQREREKAALEFYDGKQWPQEVINSRQGQPGNATNGLPPVPARPTLTIDKVREPVRQVLNQERQADLGITIAAVDDFGEHSGGISDAEIELREGLVRRIQRESQATDARSWGFQRSTIAGRGFYRVMTRCVPGKSFDQDIYVDRIYNQACVLLDPSHEQPDGSDAEWGFIGTDLPWDRYVQEYGRINDKPNKLTQASSSEWRALGDELPGWFTADGDQRAVRIVEYWYREPVARTLVQLQDGSAVYDDEYDGLTPLGVDDNGDQVKRTVYDTKVCWAKLDGVQVLEQTDWPGKYIPIIKVLGEEIQPYDSQRRAVGMVEPAMGAQRAYNAMVSKWVEQIALAPIPPWQVPAGGDEGFEAEYAMATTRTLSTLHYNPYDEQGRPLPPPSRTSIRMEIEAIAGSVTLFDQAISSLTAAPPDPRLTNVDPRVKTARGLQQLLDQSTKGTSHFMDNLQRSIRYEGLIINDLLPHIYNRPNRLARLMTASGDTKAVTLGSEAPPAPGVTQQTTTAPQPQVYTLTPGATFNVAVTVSKNYDTRRQEQESTLAQLIQTEPQLMGVFGDLLFKYNDGPGHEELEQRAQVMLAPPVQALLKGQQAPDPQVAQLTQQVQHLTMLLQTKTAEVQAKGQIDLQKTQQDNATKLEVVRIQQEGAFAVASLKAQIESINTALAALQAERAADHEARAQKIDAAKFMVDTHQQQADRAHELGMAAVDHAATLAQNDQLHQQSLEQGQQAGAIQSQQIDQQAALAPAPEAGA